MLGKTDKNVQGDGLYGNDIRNKEKHLVSFWDHSFLCLHGTTFRGRCLGKSEGGGHHRRNGFGETSRRFLVICHWLDAQET